MLILNWYFDAESSGLQHHLSACDSYPFLQYTTIPTFHAYALVLTVKIVRECDIR